MVESLITIAERAIEKQRHEVPLDESSENVYNGFNAHISEDIQNLAREFSHESTTNSINDLHRLHTNMSEVPGINPYTDEAHSREKLNPESDNFNAKFWIKNLRKLYDSDPDYYKPSRLGIAYRDLRAYAVATDYNYQPTVANVFWKLLNDGVHYLKKHDDSIYFDILKPMDGIMKPGELTVVLGRPGAGCSTLLKTLASQTYGFHIGKESKLAMMEYHQQRLKNIIVVMLSIQQKPMLIFHI